MTHVKLNDFRDKAVIITGGTKGIGLATGLSFAREGAHVYLTHRWGSADEDEIRKQFADAGAREPAIVEADVGQDDDTQALLELVSQDHDGVEVFVSNVCIVQPAMGVDSYKRRSLLKSLEYSAWPFVAYTQQIKKRFDRYPRYVIGVSSDGPDNYFAHYEFVALSKAVMETLCRYVAKDLQGEDIRLNILRTRNVLTDAVEEVFGEFYKRFVGKYAGEMYFITPEEIGDTILCMCSGLLDAMNGQVIMVDKGIAFADGLMHLMDRHEELGMTF
ncbi:MAG: SDR family oxidoreductase [Deltaproteobacteria bacterium]|nr:SDR family oxidoreductase [Deltaproteobacteria bacterium]MBW2536574.1 SDR family oxidoreductase [Deltaproteobacteria bacterium]